MAFDNVWSNIIPAGSDPANTADDEIRQLRLDLDQRLDTIVGDWSADPIVDLLLVRRTVHWSAGSFDPLGSDTNTEGYKVSGVGLHPAAIDTSLTWRMPMNIPVGAILQTIDARVFRDNVLNLMNIEVVEADDAIPSEFVLATQAVGSITGWVNNIQSSLALTRAQDKPLLVKVNMVVPPLLAAIDGAQLFQVHYEYDLTHALQGITG